MRLRAAATAGLLATTVCLALTATACGDGSKECGDYDSRREAQEAFADQEDGTEGLDSDDDGKACENWPSGPGSENEDAEGDE